MEGALALIDQLEAAGTVHNRAWALATAARCRALVQPAHGDLDGALGATEESLRQHARLPMPLELAQTLLARDLSKIYAKLGVPSGVFPQRSRNDDSSGSAPTTRPPRRPWPRWALSARAAWWSVPRPVATPTPLRGPRAKARALLPAFLEGGGQDRLACCRPRRPSSDRKSTRLNSSHRTISYAV